MILFMPHIFRILYILCILRIFVYFAYFASVKLTNRRWQLNLVKFNSHIAMASGNILLHPSSANVALELKCSK